MNKDRHEDETLIKQIQESFGGSDEQLQARMDRIEKSLTSDEFAGAEDRIMSKLMARIAVEEKTVEISAVADNALETAEGTPEETEVKEEKTVRFGSKKIFLVAALAATFAGVLGVTAIGEKSYFFREDERRVEVIFDSGRTIADVSSLEEAFEVIQEQLGEKVFALNYYPEEALFEELSFVDGRAKIVLRYNNSYIYFIQWNGRSESSVNVDSDRNVKNKVRNEWLGKELLYSENILESGETEFESKIEEKETMAYISGKLEREEFEKILKNIYFY